jgi:hypothetical protein
MTYPIYSIYLRSILPDEAECHFDPELHTGPEDPTAEPPAERQAREDVAREVCDGCPVRMACLKLAVDTLPEAGVWAGYTADEIAELAAPLLSPAALGLGEVA